jgi:predicted nucleotidyltransferase
MARSTRLQDVRDVVAAHSDEIRRLHVRSLAVFGSVARGEPAPRDVDLLVDFEIPPGLDAYMDLKLLLEDALEVPVDLVTTTGLRPELRQRVFAEAVRVA